ncbi:EF-P 5-aminopentanol modification-associated protein YfmH [Streptococcus pluranimalium]|uniref:EF-P 5-aminopentanol modification-associated protein YfmH n=1 Tax=Streptococcus pluranimalium TaxID=82348 RepID=UPI0039FD1EFD
MQRKHHTYPNIDISVEEVILDSGLRLLLVVRPDFNETQVSLSTPFGSTHHKVKVGEQEMTYPLGTAHFLEHKLFELTDGQDALEAFTAIGAEANAFTTYQQTVYYFTTVNKVNTGIHLLLNLVKTFHISPESLEEERAIIQNELLMYEDDSDYQLNKALLVNLYPDSPLSEDIGGNASSIAQISLADLKSAYQHFYPLNQLTMVVVGDFDVDNAVKEVSNAVNLIDENEKINLEDKVSTTPMIQEPVIKNSRLTMAVKQSKLGLGYRVIGDLEGYTLQYYKIGLQLFLAMTMGWTAKSYQNWYDRGLIDYSFDVNLEISSGFKFVTITVDTDQPIAMSQKIKQVFEKYANSPDFSKEHLRLLKKEMYGDFIKSLDSIDQLASQITLGLADDSDYLATGDVIRQISLDEIREIVDHFVQNMASTTVTIFPK